MINIVRELKNTLWHEAYNPDVVFFLVVYYK